MKFNKQKVMKVLPFVILGYAFNKVSQAFTGAAGYAAVVAFLVVDQFKHGTEALGHVHIVAVLGVSFRYLRGDKLLAADLKPLYKAYDTFP